jgi:uncharacterized protein YbjT (DUF2867 family)
VETVAVFGSSGPIGQAQVRLLRKRGYNTIAITRNPEILKAPEFDGAVLRDADYFDVDSLDRALRGVSAVFFQPPGLLAPTSWLEPAGNVCTAALRHGVRRLVLNSSQWAPESSEPCGQPAYDTSRKMEDVFCESGLSVTVFRPVLYMENLLTLFFKPPIVEESTYRYCHRPGLEASWICMDDVAQFMLSALERPDLAGRRFTIGGPEKLKIEDVVSILSDVMGRVIRFEYMRPRQFGKYLYARLVQDLGRARASSILGSDSNGLAEFLDSFYAFNNYSPHRPFEVEMSRVLSVLPVPLTSLREWAGKQDWSSPKASRRSGTRIL